MSISDDDSKKALNTSNQDTYQSVDEKVEIEIPDNNNNNNNNPLASHLRRHSTKPKLKATVRGQGGYISDLPQEGYCMVFRRITKFYEVQVINDDILTIKKNPLLQLTDDEYEKKRPIIDAFDENNFLINFKEANIKYTIRYSSDPMKEYIYVIITTDRDIAKEFAAKQAIDVEIYPPEAVICGRSVDEFLLAHRTYVPGEYDGKETNYDDDEFFQFQGDQHTKMKIDKWKHIHIPYKKHVPQQVYSQPIITHKLFLRILYEMLTADYVNIPPLPENSDITELEYRSQFEMCGAGCLIQRAIAERGNPLLFFFALSSSENDDDIEKWGKMKEILKCNSKKGWDNKVDDIREYYGESIAFYFAFVVHYIKWLYPMAIIGTIFFCLQIGMNDISLNGSTLLVFIAIIWSVLMSENWYRRENKLKFKWGMMRFESSEVPLPTFKGKLALDERTGKFTETFASVTMYYLKIIFSLSSVILCVSIVVSIIAVSWLLKSKLAKNDDTFSFLGSLAIGVINGILIQIFNYIYKLISLWLNEMEGHRLKKSYDNHLVFKRICFIIINSFNSCFIIAYFNDYNDNDDMLKALRFQLLTLFFTAIIIQNFMEIILPMIYTCLCKWCEKKKEEKYYQDRQQLITNDDNAQLVTDTDGNTKDVPLLADKNAYIDESINKSTKVLDNDEDMAQTNTADVIRDIETQVLLPIPFDVLANTSEIVVLHGYVILFVIACPVMPLLCLLNNYVEIRIDFWNLMKAQRPVPYPADGIGIWKLVMSVFNIVGIFSNMTLITFRTTLVDDILNLFWFSKKDTYQPDQGRIVFFFVLTMFIIAAIIFFRWIIDDVTQSTQDALARQTACEKNLLLSGHTIKAMDADEYKKQQNIKQAVEQANVNVNIN